MKQILQNYKTGDLILEEVSRPICKPHGVLVQNAFSLVSSGTERMKVEQAKLSLVGKAKSRPDQVQKFLANAKQEGFIRTYKKAMDRLDTPTPLGYSCAGKVVEVGRNVDEFHVGELIACAGAGYANHAEFNFVPANLCAHVLGGVSLQEAALTTVGSIALQSIRQGSISICENVAVIGLGLIGQLVTQILKAMSCRVIGIDLDKSKIALASELGADFVFHRNEEMLNEKIVNATTGFGVDAVIITAATSSNDTIILAGDILRDRGTIVIVGNVKMDLPWKRYYEKELNLVFSRSYGPGRYDKFYEEKGLDYPIGYIRWTEKRNMQGFLELLRAKKIKTDKLVSHCISFEKAVEGYRLLEKDRSILSILFDYGLKTVSGQNGKIEGPVEIYPTKKSLSLAENSHLGISFIGAGKFAETMLLPHLKAHPRVYLTSVVSGSGISAKKIAKKFGFEKNVAEISKILNDPNVGTIFITTRHNLHASLVIEGLQHGKNVFVEKPLALNFDELSQIIKAMSSTSKILMVGYNRRFSEHARYAREVIRKTQGPIEILYRVNAGYFPSDHWYQDSEEGGGRIIGEVCHFVDLIQFLTESKPTRVYAETISGNYGALNNDNISILIKLSNGSIATIKYIANGDPSFEKERIEIFGNKIVVVIENFKCTTISAQGKTKRFKTKGTRKGHREELNVFIESIYSGGPPPISFEDLVMTTLTTFKIIDSICTGEPAEVNLQKFMQEASV